MGKLRCLFSKMVTGWHELSQNVDTCFEENCLEIMGNLSRR